MASITTTTASTGASNLPKNLTDGYKAYRKNYMAMAAEYGFDPNNFPPLPYSAFQHRVCVLCAEIIADDPFGNNPAPFRQDYPRGNCCSACNSKHVVPMRLMMMTAATGAEKAKVKKDMKDLDAFFSGRVPAPMTTTMPTTTMPSQATLTQKQKKEKVAALRAELALLGVVKGNCNCDHCADSISGCKIPVAEDCEFYVAPK